jgi:hypothetical protein
MTRMIYCPGPERWITLAQYIRSVRLAKANLDREFKCGLTCWWPCTGREIVQQFLGGVHDRINQGVSASERGKPPVP